MDLPASKDQKTSSDHNTHSSPSDNIMEEKPKIGIAGIARDPPSPTTPFQESMPRVPYGGPSHSGAPYQHPQGRPLSAAPYQYLQGQQYPTASYPYGYGPAHGYDSTGFAGRRQMQYPDMERSLQNGPMDTAMGWRAPYGPAVSPTSDLSGRVAALEQLALRMEKYNDENTLAIANLAKKLRRSRKLSVADVGQDSQEDDKSLVLLPKKRSISPDSQGDAAGAAKRAKRASRRDVLDLTGTAHTFLDFLKKMDCNSNEDLARVANVVEGDVSLEFPLSSESGMPRVYYYLKVGGNLSTLIYANPEDEVAQPEPDREMAINLSLLELAVGELGVNAAAAHSDANNNNNKNGTPGLPRFVMPLGEVYMVNRSHRKTQMVCSSNFFVVMDITSPRKSLWMVYREDRPFERRDGGCEWDTVSLIGTTSFFKGGKRGFHVVRLLDDVMDWRSHEEEMVAMEHVAEVLSREAGWYRKPFVLLPVFSVLKREVKQGWEAGVKAEEEETMGLTV